ncbi:Prophage CP4-57 regulatory [mine drainage metagenome]|uniref:Prophage CP4-57 regulatory n=1 Tax=mine drainage metagenome TaxID=410659 RepID=T0Y620_9ZZZZ
MHTPIPATPHLLRLPAVIEATGCARSTINDAIRAGTFPKPVPLGGRTVAWSSNEIDAWIAGRIAERDAKAAA